ncbi:MAG: hypothetical protein ACOZEN_09445 [Thermodesulfobacteriota bacterium]
MGIESRIERLERTTGGAAHIVVVNNDGDTDAARYRYEASGRTIRPGDSVTYVHTGIDHEPGGNAR